jgi:hypothetical protein
MAMPKNIIHAPGTAFDARRLRSFQAFLLFGRPRRANFSTRSTVLSCAVVQGTKEISLGNRSFTHDTGATLLITADAPAVSRITCAGAAEPYRSRCTPIRRWLLSFRWRCSRRRERMIDSTD